MTVAQAPLAASETRSLLGGFRAALTLMAAIGLIFAAMLLPVVQSSDATTTGYAIRTHEQELADLNAKTYTIQAQIAQLDSIGRIQQEAARLGMVPAPPQAAAVSVNAATPGELLLPRRYLPQPVAIPEPPQHGLLWQALHVLSLR